MNQCINHMIGMFLLCFATVSQAEVEQPIELWIDADYSISVNAAQAIELGVRTALDEVGGTLAGRSVVLVPRDHRGNVKRAFRTLQSFVESDNALAMIGGVHSPPYLTYRDFINENEILLLLTWSAAGPITRPSLENENWIFRLSLDDTKVGGFLINHAIEANDCQDIGLLMVDTGWGRFNLGVMQSELDVRGEAAVIATLFPATMGEAFASDTARKVDQSGADCVVLVSGSVGSNLIANALGRLEAPPTVISHWGMLGGDFTEQVLHETRERLGYQVIQSCGVADVTPNDPQRQRILTSLRLHDPEIEALTEIPASVGFVHAYDTTRLLISAVSQLQSKDVWPETISEQRSAIRHTLENLDTPVAGLLKTYDRPFHPYETAGSDAHEALEPSDFCMMSFDERGHLSILVGGGSDASNN